MKTPVILVTGSCGLIGSEVCIDFARRGFEVHGVDSNHRAVFFGPRRHDTSWKVCNGCKRRSPLTCTRCSTSVTATRSSKLVDEVRPRAVNCPHRGAAIARSRGRDSVSRFRSERARHAAPARSGAAVLCGLAVHPYVDKQSLRRPAEYYRAQRIGRNAGTTLTPPSNTAYRKTFPSTNRNIPSSARRKWPAT